MIDVQIDGQDSIHLTHADIQRSCVSVFFRPAFKLGERPGQGLYANDMSTWEFRTSDLCELARVSANIDDQIDRPVSQPQHGGSGLFGKSGDMNAEQRSKFDDLRNNMHLLGLIQTFLTCTAITD